MAHTLCRSGENCGLGLVLGLVVAVVYWPMVLRMSLIF